MPALFPCMLLLIFTKKSLIILKQEQKLHLEFKKKNTTLNLFDVVLLFSKAHLQYYARKLFKKFPDIHKKNQILKYLYKRKQRKVLYRHRMYLLFLFLVYNKLLG